MCGQNKVKLTTRRLDLRFDFGHPIYNYDIRNLKTLRILKGILTTKTY